MRAARRAARAAAAPEVTRVGYAPIVRVDEERREIELCATSEAVDTYGTIFSYEASRDAFDRWAGNVREMHDRKAVGQRVAVHCDDQARKVYVRVRISTGAEDTGGAAASFAQPITGLRPSAHSLPLCPVAIHRQLVDECENSNDPLGRAVPAVPTFPCYRFSPLRSWSCTVRAAKMSWDRSQTAVPAPKIPRDRSRK